MPLTMREESRRFYDGGLPPHAGAPEVPPDPDRDPRIVLERVEVDGEERFVMLRRIAYRDRHVGEVLVPRDIGAFVSDLASVPWLFTWLVPRTGAHLPAALLHDGLVHGEREEPTYVSREGRRIDRVAADRIFRDAMADTGTAVVRRWLAWAAVCWWTMVDGRGTDWSPRERWRYRLAAVLTTGVLAYLGLCATLDLADLDVPGLLDLPWLGERAWWVDLAVGAAAAIVVPLLLGLTWGRFRMAGWILGVGFAVLIHVTVVLVVLTVLYRTLEALVRRWPGAMLASGTAVTVGALALVVLRLLGMI